MTLSKPLLFAIFQWDLMDWPFFVRFLIGNITHAWAKGPFTLFQLVLVRSLSDDLCKMPIRTLKTVSFNVLLWWSCSKSRRHSSCEPRRRRTPADSVQRKFCYLLAFSFVGFKWELLGPSTTTHLQWKKVARKRRKAHGTSRLETSRRYQKTQTLWVKHNGWATLRALGKEACNASICHFDLGCW